MHIKENIIRIKKEIVNVQLVAVTKTRSAIEIKEAIDAGIKIIGENRIQEAERKYAELSPILNKNYVELHFIGHLQSNKAKKAVEIFDVIQSVDSFELAKMIDKRAKEIKKVQRIFIEINIGNETQKSGTMPEKLSDLVKEVKNLKNIKLDGLMCIPPYSDNPEASRKYFREMKRIFEESGLEFLSMGMTNDYKVAIEEGSNMVRIGMGIFSERKY